MADDVPYVWVTQEMPNLKYNTAEEYGELKFLSASDYRHTTDDSEYNDNLTAVIARKLKDYNEDLDYVIPAGSPIIMMVVSAILSRRGVKKFNILKWDNRDMIYVPMRVTI